MHAWNYAFPAPTLCLAWCAKPSQSCRLHHAEALVTPRLTSDQIRSQRSISIAAFDSSRRNAPSPSQGPLGLFPASEGIVLALTVWHSRNARRRLTTGGLS